MSSNFDTNTKYDSDTQTYIPFKHISDIPRGGHFTNQANKRKTSLGSLEPQHTPYWEPQHANHCYVHAINACGGFRWLLPSQPLHYAKPLDSQHIKITGRSLVGYYSPTSGNYTDSMINHYLSTQHKTLLSPHKLPPYCPGNTQDTVAAHIISPSLWFSFWFLWSWLGIASFSLRLVLGFLLGIRPVLSSPPLSC